MCFIWATVFLATILLVWRERNQSVANRRADEEDARFIAAAETSPDAFFIFDAVRNNTRDIVDFRFVYVNRHAEKLLQTPRANLLNQDLCVLFPIHRTNGMFDKYRKVVLDGEPLSEEYSVDRRRTARKSGCASASPNSAMAWPFGPAMHPTSRPAKSATGACRTSATQSSRMPLQHYRDRPARA